jgi:hypothetical protein
MGEPLFYRETLQPAAHLHKPGCQTLNMQLLPAVQWIEADQNPWKIRVLDVRPVTQT